MKRLYCDVCEKETNTVFKLQVIQHDSISNPYTSSYCINTEICQECLDKVKNILNNKELSSNCGNCDDCGKCSCLEDDKEGIIIKPVVYKESPDSYTTLEIKPKDTSDFIKENSILTKAMEDIFGIDASTFKKIADSFITDITNSEDKSKEETPTENKCESKKVEVNPVDDKVSEINFEELLNELLGKN